MTKFLNIFMGLLLIFSSFDVIDVQDLTLGGKAIFSSQKDDSNHENDSITNPINIKISYISLNFFPKSVSFTHQTPKQHYTLIISDGSEYNKYSKNLYRPPNFKV